jgi:hypothetical protein
MNGSQCCIAVIDYQADPRGVFEAINKRHFFHLRFVFVLSATA